jgi:hypothetical protein
MWDENGKKIKEATWVAGELVDSKDFGEK